ncbi:leukocyte elastase inhibitor-like isoform X1 [Ornithodoros turicata]|uniref:leukocyte elastase inhibitor-like isoform X1 n=1 Tax=Ornithodoros turicata TaxID=34597 RepID=UPI003139F9D1
MGTKVDLVQPLLHFAIDVYKQVQRSDTFFSPFSIAAALSMTLPGTRGNTAKEIATALHIKEDIHEAFSQLQKSLQGCACELNIANRIYSDRKLNPVRAFCALLEEYYSTTLGTVDFGEDDARQKINAWVEQVTNDKIKDLLAPDTVDSSTMLVIVNAVYFKGAWEKTFPPYQTEPMDFYETSSTTKKVDMMFQKKNFRMGYNEELKVTTLELPYTGDEASMVILLPDEIEGLKFAQDRLTVENLASALHDMRMEREVELFLPKFKIEQTMGLKKVLMDLGVKDMFSDSADLTGITERKGVKFSDAVHKAYVDVNEEGTEAAAATAFVMNLGCCLGAEVPKPKVFKVDHPFMFFILARDVVLFFGSLTHPV